MAVASEKDFWRVWGVAVVTFLTWILLAFLGVPKGFVYTSALVVIVISFFWHRLGKTAKPLRALFGTVGAVLFLLSWAPTRPTTEWFMGKLATSAPRENFDPVASSLIPTSKFVRLPDERLKRVPPEWQRDSDTGIEAVPATQDLAVQYFLQRTRGRVGSTNTRVQLQFNKPELVTFEPGETTATFVVPGRPGNLEYRGLQGTAVPIYDGVEGSEVKPGVNFTLPPGMKSHDTVALRGVTVGQVILCVSPGQTPSETCATS